MGEMHLMMVFLGKEIQDGSDNRRNSNPLLARCQEGGLYQRRKAANQSRALEIQQVISFAERRGHNQPTFPFIELLLSFTKYQFTTRFSKTPTPNGSNSSISFFYSTDNHSHDGPCGLILGHRVLIQLDGSHG
jgi:hypothetical protein